ncbi:MAG TPA: hypothetical protein VKT25_04975 [Ktedonobacteraceae bacterium]|nr:hypothetical protein [Ktedonobacteraceae bacterium]
MKWLTSFLLLICRGTIAGAFWIATRLSWKVEVHGRSFDSGARRSYIGMAHKRDLDPLMLLPTLIFRQSWRRLRGELQFALRGDAFEPGYLGRLVLQPYWLSRLLRVLSLGAVLRWLGAHSTDALVRPAEVWLREALRYGGDRPASEALAPPFLAELAEASGETREQVASAPLSRLLSWRYHLVLPRFYGTEILAAAMRRPLQQRMVTQIKHELATLDDRLWEGCSLYGSPEGQLSPDGRLSPISAGFHRIMRAAPQDTRIVPVALVYDFMTTQRPRVFIDFAPPLLQAPQLAPGDLDAALRSAWLTAARFTCTQLASGFLKQIGQQEGVTFTLDDLACHIHVQAKKLASEDRHVDARLLDRNGARKRARGYLAYATHHKLVRLNNDLTYTPTTEEPPLKLRLREVGYDLAPLTYACNELKELLELA